MEIPVSQQAAEQGWSPAQIITDLGVERLTQLAEEQGYPHPADTAQRLHNQAQERRDRELAALLGEDKKRAAGKTGLLLVNGTIVTKEEFDNSRAA
ncbi:MAG: hypothetical protein Q4B05_03620 [Candidatus Saccharibacteria bacterium]|nr:hypothetical protein [Candidatus Saccharibacteria bacterium]